MSGACRDALSILVVEDDPAVAELVRTVLERVPDWGATVAHDAAAARRAFEHGRVEVLLLDVNLPDSSGPELLEVLRRAPTWDGPPAILMSADADQPEIGAALRRGAATTFLRKPFEIDRLVEEVRSAAAARREGGRERGRGGYDGRGAVARATRGGGCI
jgi:two-component system, OmpR family, KDP operon response regulator KdpE